MKRILLITLLMLAAAFAQAQDTLRPAQVSFADSTYSFKEGPQFPGGYDSLMSYYSRNLQYPREAQEKSIEGTVIVSFVVEKD